MDKVMELWERCVDFHGHICPGLARGYKAVLVALEELGVQDPAQESMVAIVEHTGCGVDAVQVAAGCTAGRNNLLCRDFSKQVYVIGNKKNGDAVRVAVRFLRLSEDPSHREMRGKVIRGEATHEEKERFYSENARMCREIIAMPKEDFCTVTRVTLDFPPMAPVGRTILCPSCGEGVGESHMKEKDGGRVCPECAGK